MRIVLTLLLVTLTAVTVSADQRFRRRGRIGPLRNLRIFDGYNTAYPGPDSSYLNGGPTSFDGGIPPIPGALDSSSPAAFDSSIRPPQTNDQTFRFTPSIDGQHWMPRSTRSTPIPGPATTLGSPPPRTPGLPAIPSGYLQRSVESSYWDSFHRQ